MRGDDLTPASLDYLLRVSREKRRRLGQYFTPRTLCDELLDALPLEPGSRVLDPACGSGEFLAALARRFPDSRRVGFEIDPDLARVARSVDPGAAVVVADALEEPPRPIFDAVVGNPPYFQRRLTPAERRRFEAAISGRPQSFALFVHVGLEWLAPGGRLAFVVPPALGTGAYFAALRRSLRRRAAVERVRWIEGEGLFRDARQPVMLLWLEKGGRDSGRHWIRKDGLELIVEDPRPLVRAFGTAKSLLDLGCRVRTGRVVWNQAKDRLTWDDRDAVRLIWADEIGNGRLVESGRRRPRFVRGVEPDRGPAVVVNRVTGQGRSARLRAAPLPADFPFVAENHVNVVFGPPGWSERDARRLAQAFCSPEAAAVVRSIAGTTQVSARELERLVPVRL